MGDLRRVNAAKDLMHLEPFEAVNPYPNVAVIAVPGGYVWSESSEDAGTAVCFIPEPTMEHRVRWLQGIERMRARLQTAQNNGKSERAGDGTSESRDQEARATAP